MRAPMAVAALLGVVLVSGCGLAGCTSTGPPAPLPEPLTDAEVAEILRVDADIRWSALQTLVDGAPRPDVSFVAYTTAETWPATMADCMRDSGVESANVRQNGGLTYRGDGPGERIIFYGCSVAYPVDPRSEGYLSEAQRGYAWDYWVSRTVPCLLSLGYPVPDIPERDAFIGRSYAGTAWNPYSLIIAESRLPDSPVVQDPPWAAIDAQCPPLSDPYPVFH
jgi:hypothetical protein